nr:hypothetical protein [Roseobacter sp. MH60115]
MISLPATLLLTHMWQAGFATKGGSIVSASTPMMSGNLSEVSNMTVRHRLQDTRSVRAPDAAKKDVTLCGPVMAPCPVRKKAVSQNDRPVAARQSAQWQITCITGAAVD